MIPWWTAVALAKAPDACATAEQPEAGGSMSVAWVSPLGKRAGRNRYLPVVPSAELRRWVTSEPTSVARLLQKVGARKSDREPRRRYKVVVFDAHTDDLTGCGTTTDLDTGGPGLPLYGSTWTTLAADGFCVLPAERFVAGGAR
jgi:hypothetical protein